ncbi:hypothetical protein B296_00032558 [Ensete ventricosum]|uniref:Uncharacterized protein n=1 Tax=Ensete ventricosum TaxID=4639 RepID=A0A426YST8_ENSVE|nr:hypothetical protein B296_00032558 [Ensete ventricosum]
MTTEPLRKPAIDASPSFGGPSVDENEPPYDASNSASRHDFSEAQEKNADDDSDDDFEFTFSVRDADAFPSVPADEIFSGGRILPAYPVFNRDLLLLPLSAADEPTITEKDPADQIPFGRLLIEEEKVTGAAVEHFPGGPDRCKKSASTGSSMQWRLRDMVGRSHSDGKEKFVFLEAAAAAKKNMMSPNTARAAAGGKGAKEPGRLAEADTVTSHRRFHGHGKGTSDKAVKGPRRSFLPYRQQLLGLFAPVNGLRRSHNPF